MARHVPGRATLVAALHVLASTAGVAAGSSTAAGPSTDRGPPLRALVRRLGDGTALGPAIDAVARLGTDALWREATVALVGGGVVLSLAFGPVLVAVAFHWTYRRVRWLFWSLVDGCRRALAGLWSAGLTFVRRKRDGDESTGELPATPEGEQEPDRVPAD